MQIAKNLGHTVVCGLVALYAVLAVPAGDARADGAAPLLNDAGDSVQLKHDIGDIKAFESLGAKPPALKPEFTDLAGTHLDWTNEYANSKLDLAGNGTFIYSDDNGAAHISGYWWVSPAGHLCLTSQDYWRDGSCFVVRGASVDAIKAISPTYAKNVVYPVVVTRQSQ